MLPFVSKLKCKLAMKCETIFPGHQNLKQNGQNL